VSFEPSLRVPFKILYAFFKAVAARSSSGPRFSTGVDKTEVGNSDASKVVNHNLEETILLVSPNFANEYQEMRKNYFDITYIFNIMRDSLCLTHGVVQSKCHLNSTTGGYQFVFA
jgi:hypothetical protein